MRRIALPKRPLGCCSAHFKTFMRLDQLEKEQSCDCIFSPVSRSFDGCLIAPRLVRHLPLCRHAWFREVVSGSCARSSQDRIQGIQEDWLWKRQLGPQVWRLMREDMERPWTVKSAQWREKDVGLWDIGDGPMDCVFRFLRLSCNRLHEAHEGECRVDHADWGLVSQCACFAVQSSLTI